MGLFWSRLLNKIGFISDEDLHKAEVNYGAAEHEAEVKKKFNSIQNSTRKRMVVKITDPDEAEQLLIDAKTDIAKAEETLDKVLADKSNPNYKKNLDTAREAVGNAYKRPREIMNRINDTVIPILKDRKSKSSGGKLALKRTLKRARRARYSRRVAR